MDIILLKTTSPFSVLLGLTIILIILKFYWNHRQLYYYASKLPGPYPIPIIGNIFYFYGNTKDYLRKFMTISKNYPPVSVVRLLHKVIFIVSRPQDLKIVLNESLDKKEFYEFFKPGVGNGIFTSPLTVWKKHRRIINPTFNQKTLNNFVNIFTNKSEILVKILKEKHADGKIFDVLHCISLCTLDTICETALGVNLNAQIEKPEFMMWLEKSMEIISERLFKIWLHPDILWKLTSQCREFNINCRNIRKFVGNIVRLKINEYNDNNNNNKMINDNEDNKKSNRSKSFIDLLIENSNKGEYLSEIEIIDESTTFIIAGSDTSAITISFCLLMLGMHPNVQEKVYNELFEIFGDSNRPITPEDLTNMVYLERVIKETMRLYPIAPILGRNIQKNLQLDDCVIPKDGVCMIFIYNLHRNPEIWSNPTIFDPDRFLPENVTKRHPYSYMPFSMGPRNCIGFRYGLMNMKTIIASVVRNFKIKCNLKSIDDVKVSFSITIKSDNGYQVSLEQRNHY